MSLFGQLIFFSKFEKMKFFGLELGLDFFFLINVSQIESILMLMGVILMLVMVVMRNILMMRMKGNMIVVLRIGVNRFV